MRVIVITGPPYSGKGTQCEILEETLNYKHISTGDRIRKEKEEKSPIGICLLYTSPSPRDATLSRMPSSA